MNTHYLFKSQECFRSLVCSMILFISGLINGFTQEAQHPVFEFASDTNSYSIQQTRNEKYIHGIVTPTNFIHKMSSADFVVITNVWPDMLPPTCKTNYVQTLSGPDVSRLTKGLSKLSGERMRGVVIGRSQLELHFYHGTNLLAVADFQGKFINCEDGGDFQDDTGLLDELYNPFEKFCLNAVTDYNKYMIENLGREEESRKTNHAPH